VNKYVTVDIPHCRIGHRRWWIYMAVLLLQPRPTFG